MKCEACQRLMFHKLKAQAGLVKRLDAARDITKIAFDNACSDYANENAEYTRMLEQFRQMLDG